MHSNEVEERRVNEGAPSGYTGHLYSYRESESRVILRTLVYTNSLSRIINIGFQDLIDNMAHNYSCVASNEEKTNTANVSITPILGNLFLLLLFVFML